MQMDNGEFVRATSLIGLRCRDVEIVFKEEQASHEGRIIMGETGHLYTASIYTSIKHHRNQKHRKSSICPEYRCNYHISLTVIFHYLSKHRTRSSFKHSLLYGEIISHLPIYLAPRTLNSVSRYFFANHLTHRTRKINNRPPSSCLRGTRYFEKKFRYEVNEPYESDVLATCDAACIVNEPGDKCALDSVDLSMTLTYSSSLSLPSPLSPSILFSRST